MQHTRLRGKAEATIHHHKRNTHKSYKTPNGRSEDTSIHSINTQYETPSTDLSTKEPKDHLFNTNNNQNLNTKHIDQSKSKKLGFTLDHICLTHPTSQLDCKLNREILFLYIEPHPSSQNLISR